MAGGTFEDGDEEITGINVTPFVDVMLVLLVIFMVTTTYIVKRSIDLNLPKASTGETAPPKTLDFAIDKSEQLFFNGKRIEFSEIEAVIELERKTQAEDQKISVLISADQITPHGAVIKLIDAIRKSGINDFAINVESPEEPVEPKN
ncbi:MAG: biopolymer transporter ExbD [Oligoflexales bacterium]|nr:biopolymer transporter ExbD [Oligoflexales bacterium]